MKLEDQVVSLELAKRLKELGVKQESAFWWHNLGHRWKLELGGENTVMEHYAALTVAEMVEIIEDSANEWACGYNDSGCFYHFMKGNRGTSSMLEGCFQKDSVYHSSGDENDNFTNAVASWLIHLIEQKLVNP